MLSSANKQHSYTHHHWQILEGILSVKNQVTDETYNMISFKENSVVVVTK
jgi:hypothetical protein